MEPLVPTPRAKRRPPRTTPGVNSKREALCREEAGQGGVDAVLLDEADDAEDIKAAVIDLILAC